MQEEWMLLRHLSKDPPRQSPEDPRSCSRMRSFAYAIRFAWLRKLRLADAMPSPDACVGRAALKPDIAFWSQTGLKSHRFS